MPAGGMLAASQRLPCEAAEHEQQNEKRLGERFRISSAWQREQKVARPGRR